LRSALIASGLALPARRITVNLRARRLPKKAAHYDLPIALKDLMRHLGLFRLMQLSGFTVLGELGLDGSIAPVAGVLRRRSAPIRARRADLPRLPAARRRLGEPGHPDHRRAFADPASPTTSRHPVLSRPQPKVHEREERCSPARHQGQESANARWSSPPPAGITS